MAEKLYSIKINKTGRYVLYCDEHWYETSSEELRIYTKSECERIKEQMKSHYVYGLTISDGTETILDDKPVEKAVDDFGLGQWCTSKAL